MGKLEAPGWIGLALGAWRAGHARREELASYAAELEWIEADTNKVVFRPERVSPCRGEFAGSALMEREGAILRGSCRGVSCTGDQVSAAFEVTREAP